MRHRPLAADDLPALHAIFTDPEVAPFLDEEPVPLDAFRPAFDALVRAGETILVVGDDGGGPVIATYRLRPQAHRSAHVVTLASFAVAAPFRGRGVGARVLEAVVEAARGRGWRRIELFVERDNPRAIRLYERCGFVVEGVLRAAFRRQGAPVDVDEIVMGRLL